ncbi:MAG: helix-turn-helix domain-containing protein [Eggerthellaceae bacterium]|nr:helix-turn-helix domain-containing protein [Eggerthellaceae bacterium]
MNQYVTGATIKELRERKAMTQADLAGKLSVSDKAVSKWETGKGYPDITLLEPLAQALGVSIAELISGNTVVNTNVSANMARCKFYVCPVCGNVLASTGEASISCHGVELMPLEPDDSDECHMISMEQVEDELFVQVDHPMTKRHYISFLAAVSPDRVQLVKTYPESNAEARFKIDQVSAVYAYCNKDGLFRANAIRNRS